MPSVVSPADTLNPFDVVCKCRQFHNKYNLPAGNSYLYEYATQFEKEYEKEFKAKAFRYHTIGCDEVVDKIYKHIINDKLGSFVQYNQTPNGRVIEPVEESVAKEVIENRLLPGVVRRRKKRAAAALDKNKKKKNSDDDSINPSSNSNNNKKSSKKDSKKKDNNRENRKAVVSQSATSASISTAVASNNSSISNSSSTASAASSAAAAALVSTNAVSSTFNASVVSNTTTSNAAVSNTTTRPKKRKAAQMQYIPQTWYDPRTDMPYDLVLNPEPVEPPKKVREKRIKTVSDIEKLPWQQHMNNFTVTGSNNKTLPSSSSLLQSLLQGGDSSLLQQKSPPPPPLPEIPHKDQKEFIQSAHNKLNNIDHDWILEFTKLITIKKPIGELDNNKRKLDPKETIENLKRIKTLHNPEVNERQPPANGVLFPKWLLTRDNIYTDDNDIVSKNKKLHKTEARLKACVEGGLHIPYNKLVPLTNQEQKKVDKRKNKKYKPTEEEQISIPSKDELELMTNANLKSELKQYGLKTSGRKQELIDRLLGKDEVVIDPRDNKNGLCFRRYLGVYLDGNACGWTLSLDYNLPNATIQHVLVPIFKATTSATSTYAVSRPIDNDIETVYYNGSSYSAAKFNYCKINESYVFVDINNILDLGENMAYCMVGNYCTGEVIQSCKTATSKMTHNLIFYLMVCCHVRYDQDKKRIDNQSTLKREQILYHQHKTELDNILQLETEFISKLKDAFSSIEALAFIFGDASNNNKMRLDWSDFERLLWLGVSPLSLYYLFHRNEEERDRCLKIINKLIKDKFPGHLQVSTQDDIYGLQPHVTEYINNTMLWQCELIIGISAQSTDADTFHRFRQLTHELNDPRTLLSTLEFLTIGELIEGLVEICRGSSGFHSIRAMFTIYSAIISVVYNDGGYTKDDMIFGLTQVKWKKQRLIQNIPFLFGFEGSSWYGIGNDSHVQHITEVFCMYILGDIYTKASKSKQEDFQNIIYRRMDKKVAIFANEIIGQIGQWFARGTNVQYELLKIIHNHLEVNKIFHGIFTEWKKFAKRADVKYIYDNDKSLELLSLLADWKTPNIGSKQTSIKQFTKNQSE